MEYIQCTLLHFIDSLTTLHTLFHRCFELMGLANPYPHFRPQEKQALLQHRALRQILRRASQLIQRKEASTKTTI